MSKRALVSIIMPAYNTEKYIKKAIDSVINQTFKNWELIIVNDASTDNTKKILERYSKNPKIKIFTHDKNRGPAGAKNTGLKYAKGKYVCFLDADDVYESNKLEKQIQFLKKNPVINMVYTDYLIIDKNGKIMEKRKTFEFNSDLLFEYNFIPGMSVMLKKSVLDNIGFFDERLRNAEDYDLWLKVAEKYKIKKLSMFSFRRREHPTQLSRHLLFRRLEKIKRRPLMERSLNLIRKKWMKKRPEKVKNIGTLDYQTAVKKWKELL